MTLISPSINISVENPNSNAASKMITELTNELDMIYGNNGSGNFTPADVLVPGGFFVVAWFNNNPIGCGALRPFNEPGVGEIKRMYVKNSLRGKHIAGLILEKLEELGRTFGYSVIKLETGLLQPGAIRFYERSGFNRIPCYSPYNNEELSACFEKRLD